MCGIAGYLDLWRRHRVQKPIVEAMNRKLIHRGPDSEGYFVEPDVGLGVRRLAIIDLETGDQPISNEDGSVVMVCNGEIFNHRELRRTLRGRGHVFRTATDVEVLVHLYEELGPDLVSELDGQFALAVYDRRRRRLFLARDHFGINPLFYTVCEGFFIFGSEIKAILEHPRVERQVDLTGLDQVLSLPGLVSPRTLFKGIESLRGGHSLLVQDGRVTTREYWDLEYPEVSASVTEQTEEQAVARLEEILSTSVKRRLLADVPVGLFLSGGVDSSLVAALVGECSPEIRRHTFSVAFQDPEIDESRHQRLMARRLGSEHHEILLDESEMVDRLRRMVLHCECPVKETFNTCALSLSEAARDAGVKVVLAGQGADEFFGGYPGYRMDALKSRAASSPPSVEEVLEEELREELWGDPNLFYEKDQVVFREVKQALYSRAVNERFAEFECLRHPLVDSRRLRARHPLHQRSYLDLKLRLTDHLLADHGDRMALANSVEVRYPFLDVTLTDFVRFLTPELKLKGLQEKYILKRIARGRVPPAILEREKFGFRAPGSPQLLRCGRKWVDELLAPEYVRSRGYFDPQTVERLKQQYAKPEFRVHQHLETDLLMLVLSFHLCLELFDLPSLI